jgi:PAS domain S-box-containing protein
MRQWLRDLPVARKSTLIVMLTSSVALLLTCAGFVTFAQIAFRETLVRDITTTAQIIGDNSAAALSFGDPESAEETLKSLAAKSYVAAAAIYDRDGALFGTYRRHADADAFVPPPPESDMLRFGRDRIDLFRDIDLAGEKAGTIYIRASLGEMYERLLRYALTSLLVMLAALLVAYLFARRLQRLIADPISHLAAVVGQVAVDKDYSVRAAKTSDDELGRLIEGFNGMLHQIQLRDAELQDARGSLERRVGERTAELELEIAERRHAERALRSSEERFSTAFEHAAIGMALVAPTGELLKVNRAMCELVGYAAEDLRGRTFQALTHPDDLAADLENVRRVLAGEIPTYQIEKRYLHRQGHPVWALLSVSLVRDAGGAPLHFISQIQDISQRKRAEAELEETHRQLLDASRQSGMAEVATNVLHNVGNVLNSVNVSATLAADRVKNARPGNLATVVELLRANRDDLGRYLGEDEKGRHILTYLEQLAAEGGSEQQALVRELEHLRTNIDHIKKIVAMQQSYAKVSGFTEVVGIADLVEDSLRINEDALLRHGIQVERRFAATPQVSVEKHKVLQILVNLIRNAIQACDRRGGSDKRIVVGIEPAGARIQVSVGDNGAGIAPENLTRVFAHGFTTRKDGHGFGLHSGAIAATELGGSLRAESDGIDRGATFTLELPIQSTGVRP